MADCSRAKLEEAIEKVRKIEIEKNVGVNNSATPKPDTTPNNTYAILSKASREFGHHLSLDSDDDLEYDEDISPLCQTNNDLQSTEICLGDPDASVHHNEKRNGASQTDAPLALSTKQLCSDSEASVDVSSILHDKEALHPKDELGESGTSVSPTTAVGEDLGLVHRKEISHTAKSLGHTVRSKVFAFAASEESLRRVDFPPPPGKSKSNEDPAVRVCEHDGDSRYVVVNLSGNRGKLRKTGDGLPHKEFESLCEIDKGSPTKSRSFQRRPLPHSELEDASSGGKQNLDDHFVTGELTAGPSQVDRPACHPVKDTMTTHQADGEVHGTSSIDEMAPNSGDKAFSFGGSEFPSAAEKTNCNSKQEDDDTEEEQPSERSSEPTWPSKCAVDPNEYESSCSQVMEDAPANMNTITSKRSNILVEDPKHTPKQSALLTQQRESMLPPYNSKLVMGTRQPMKPLERKKMHVSKRYEKEEVKNVHIVMEILFPVGERVFGLWQVYMFFPLDFVPQVRDPMSLESMRLASFRNFPHDHRPSTLRLANAGFFYTGQDDILACHFCGVTFRCDRNSAGVDPYALHRSRSPECSLVRGSESGNVFIQDEQRRALSRGDITGDGSSEARVRVPQQVQISRDVLNNGITTVETEMNSFGLLASSNNSLLPRPAAAQLHDSSYSSQPNPEDPLQLPENANHADNASHDGATLSASEADPANQSQGPEEHLATNSSALPPAHHSRNPPWQGPLAEREQPVPTSSSLDGVSQLGAVGGDGLSAAAPVAAPRSSTAFRPAHQALATAMSRHTATLPAPTTQPPIPGLENDVGVEAQGASASGIQHGNAEVESSQGAEGGWCTAQSSQDAFLEQLRCAVCLTGIVDHVFVPCGHLICEICSRNYGDNRCHICRGPIDDRVRFRLAAEQASNERNSELAIDNYLGYAIHPSAFRIVVRGHQPTPDEVQAILLEQGTWREPMHPHMRTAQARLQTLLAQHAQVPPFLLPILQEYAEAGFFLMRPDSDELVCYHCGNGIREWTGGPWAAHAQFFPNCGHLHDWI